MAPVGCMVLDVDRAVDFYTHQLGFFLADRWGRLGPSSDAAKWTCGLVVRAPRRRGPCRTAAGPNQAAGTGSSSRWMTSLL